MHIFLAKNENITILTVFLKKNFACDTSEMLLASMRNLSYW